MRKAWVKHAPISTQVIQRDRYAELLATLAIVLLRGEIALEVRHLQRTEVREAEELSRRAKGLVRHAAQAQHRHLRADMRAGKGRALERAGGVENIALCTSATIALVCRARDSARLLHTDGLPISKTEWVMKGSRFIQRM